MRALSVLLTVALLAGGLMVLVLDLGRPERLVVAATHYNFRSIFAWNMILYNGLFAIVRAVPVGAPRAALPGRTRSPWASRPSRGASSSRPAPGPSSASSSRGRPMPPASSRRSSSRCRSPGAWRSSTSRSAGCARLAGAPMDAELQARVRRLLGDLRDRRALLRGRPPPDQPVLGEAGRLRALHPGERRAVSGPLLAGLRGARQRRSAGAALPSPAGGPRATAAASGAGGARRARVPLRVHHRRAGVPPRDLPGLRGRRAPSATGEVDSYVPSLPEVLLGLGGLAASFLIALAGVRALPILPPAEVAIAGGRAGQGRRPRAAP